MISKRYLPNLYQQQQDNKPHHMIGGDMMVTGSHLDYLS